MECNREYGPLWEKFKKEDWVEFKVNVWFYGTVSFSVNGLDWLSVCSEIRVRNKYMR